MKKISLLLVMVCAVCLSQEDTIVLKDLVISDKRLDRIKTQRIIQLNDSILDQNAPLLTDVLRYNTTIFFKENGKGMVSSPSFRGTTAQQTTVLWNGIGINSGSLGQTDFNTISSLGWDEIQIKPGGGSIEHGSGAIGGSIHLNHKFEFDKGWNGTILTGYGSFNTIKGFGKVGYSSDNFSAYFSYNRNSSDNDFEIEEENFINRNGQYYNNTFNLNAAFKINAHHNISLYTEKYDDERHFVILEESANRTKYRNNNIRTLVQWDYYLPRFRETLKVGYFKEKFEYFDHIDRPYFSMGEIDKFIAQYDGIYAITPSLDITLLGEISKSKADGDNTGIMDQKQTDGNIALKLSHQLNTKIFYTVGLRKEYNKDYKSPTLFSIGVTANPIKHTSTKLNISKNFRAPSLNDLYWEPGGNKDLLAESSIQYELTEEFNIQKNTIGLSLFVNDIDNMIQWVPSGAGYWEPKNTTHVQAKGIEGYLKLNKNFGQHNFRLNSQYAYTISENQETDKQLAYVPYHKWNGSLSHAYQAFSWYIQGVFLGDAYTTTDENEDYVLEGYTTLNVGINLRIKYPLNMNLGFKINNIFNNVYEIKPKYYMPERNFEIQLITKF